MQALWVTLLTVPTIGPLLGALPPEQRDALGIALATALTGALMGAAVAGIRWLETRNGQAPGARAARFAARIIMLGLSRYQPVYGVSSPDTVPSVIGLDVAPAVGVAKTLNVQQFASVLRE